MERVEEIRFVELTIEVGVRDADRAAGQKSLGELFRDDELSITSEVGSFLGGKIRLAVRCLALALLGLVVFGLFLGRLFLGFDFALVRAVPVEVAQFATVAAFAKARRPDESGFGFTVLKVAGPILEAVRWWP